LRDVYFLDQRRILPRRLSSSIGTKCEVEGMMNRSIDRGSRWRGNPCRKGDPSAAAEARDDMKQTLPRTSFRMFKTTCDMQDEEPSLRPINVYLQGCGRKC
jgi:hypothetical protein